MDTDGTYSLKIEAEEVIKEITYAVNSVELSKVLQSTEECVFFNLETKESTKFCVELTAKGFRVLPGSSKAEDKGAESMQDRIARQRIITTAFLSEHCLPFSLAGDILDLAKCLAKDKTALEKCTLSPTSATYITTHGVARSLKEEVKSKVKDKYVSLNMDEATNKNNDKVLNILIQYFDDETSQVVIDHLGSRIQNVATAAEIVKSVESVLQEYDIKWSQIVSVLMDNCSTMRGVKGGVEALIREKNGCLLDISGDTVHMISNVAKTLMKNVDQGLQSICSDLYYDVEESPKVKELVCQVTTMMNAKKSKHILRPISSRFLQMYDVSTRVLEVLDYLTIYYAAFLTDEEKTKYSSLCDQIFKSHDVSEEAQAAITLLQFAQEKQQKSQTSHDRKDRIIDALFTNRTETITMLNVCRGLLSVFQLAGKQFDVMDQEEEGSRYFETIYALLDSISPGYRNTFGDTLIQKLQGLHNLQHSHEPTDT